MPESSGLVCVVCDMDEEYEHNQVRDALYLCSLIVKDVTLLSK